MLKSNFNHNYCVLVVFCPSFQKDIIISKLKNNSFLTLIAVGTWRKKWTWKIQTSKSGLSYQNVPEWPGSAPNPHGALVGAVLRVQFWEDVPKDFCRTFLEDDFSYLFQMSVVCRWFLNQMPIVHIKKPYNASFCGLRVLLLFLGRHKIGSVFDGIYQYPKTIELYSTRLVVTMSPVPALCNYWFAWASSRIVLQARWVKYYWQRIQ